MFTTSVDFYAHYLTIRYLGLLLNFLVSLLCKQEPQRCTACNCTSGRRNGILLQGDSAITPLALSCKCQHSTLFSSHPITEFHDIVLLSDMQRREDDMDQSAPAQKCHKTVLKNLWCLPHPRVKSTTVFCAVTFEENGSVCKHHVILSFSSGISPSFC